jgi:hypothetical protein
MQDDREPVCLPEEKAQQVAQERTAQSYLHYALTAERTHYTDTQEYTDDIEPLTAIESSLDWGGTIKVAVGGELDSVVCISTTSEAGTPFAVGDVAHGPLAGTYFGEECPAKITAETVSAIGGSW